MTNPKRKLIEVALPLEAINVASAREKSIRHGHPSTLHLWWARRPLAACRAVLFASLVDDPSSDTERFPTSKAQEDERTRLFGIIERLVRWENTANAEVLEEAQAEIRRATGGNPPPILDPFCGGGSIPLEAQRLGLNAYASDLNPVAVLITKALIEIPPKFANRAPVHPEARLGVGSTGAWIGAAGLAEDVRRYGSWMREEAWRRIGVLYPKVPLTKERGGGEATVIAWIWARTVTCPNPACGAHMPLIRSFVLSTRRGQEAWVVPIVDRDAKTVRFEVESGRGSPPESPKVGRGANFRCLVCGQVSPDEHIKSEGRAGRMDAQLMAVVAEGDRSRIYLAPTDADARLARSAEPSWYPEGELADDPRNIWTVNYGLTRFRDLFTPRQLVALTTFSDLVGDARHRVLDDARAAGMDDDDAPLADGGTGVAAYADAIATYLAFAVDRVADRHTTIATWDSSPTKLQLRNTFARQAIPMTWDFGEGNPFSDSSGTFGPSVQWVAEAVAASPAQPQASAKQLDATSAVNGVVGPMISTDPPYYDNIGYADLSDFFYVWLRKSLGSIYPDLFGTLLTPKQAELIATPYRFGGDKLKAEQHFEVGLGSAFAQIRAAGNPDYPVTVFYAFKQSESEGDSARGTAVASTGWETMLEGLLKAGLSIEGTWPMRSEMGNRMIASGTNALASSIVLVCRPRRIDAGVTTRSDFVGALQRELPTALRTLQHGNIAPVDLAQASIGPGMAIFSRYAKVLESNGTMTVRTALSLINQVLDEVVSEQEGEFDSDTRFAISWYSQHGFGDGAFGEADVLARARDTSVSGLEGSGILRSGGGKVRLRSRGDLDAAWDPATDRRPTVWEATQHLVRRYFDEGSELSAADLLSRLGGMGETARDLAYRLYLLCERKGWTDEARAYNGLVVAWPEIGRQAQTIRSEGPGQQTLDLGG
jgi:putative DNA methylase